MVITKVMLEHFKILKIISMHGNWLLVYIEIIVESIVICSVRCALELQIYKSFCKDFNCSISTD